MVSVRALSCLFLAAFASAQGSAPTPGARDPRGCARRRESWCWTTSGSSITDRSEMVTACQTFATENFQAFNKTEKRAFDVCVRTEKMCDESLEDCMIKKAAKKKGKGSTMGGGKGSKGPGAKGKKGGKKKKGTKKKNKKGKRGKGGKKEPKLRQVTGTIMKTCSGDDTPYTEKLIWFRKGTTNNLKKVVANATSDAEGNFEVTLEVGQRYCVIEQWKKPKLVTKSSLPSLQVNRACMQKLWKACDGIVSAKGEDSSYVSFQACDGVSAQEPCMTGPGPVRG